MTKYSVFSLAIVNSIYTSVKYFFFKHFDQGLVIIIINKWYKFDVDRYKYVS